MEPVTRKCPTDGAAMVVTQNEAMGIQFVCPVCGIGKRHDEFKDEPIGGPDDSKTD